jgi:hypothetical protein
VSGFWIAIFGEAVGAPDDLAIVAAFQLARRAANERELPCDSIIGVAEFSSANNSFHDSDSSITFRNGDGAFAAGTSASFLDSSCPNAIEPSSPLTNSKRQNMSNLVN